LDLLIPYFTSNWLEIFGFVTGVICVYFNAKEIVWAWPIAMVSVAIYAIIFYQSKLYADFGLQLFFFVLCAYGLYQWLSKSPTNQVLSVSYSNLKSNIIAFFSCVALTGILYYILMMYTDSDLPFWDALTTSMSIVAQFQLAKKKVENWIYWIVADVIYIGIYLYKGLNLTALLYFIYVFLAYYGYIQWKKTLIKTQVG
jgi:nicotinamide mononucleotide transporter